MSFQIHIYNPYSNLTVAKEYVSIIEDALNGLGLKTSSVASLMEQDKHSPNGVVVVTANDATKAKAKGYAPIITWMQGIIPEESYMRHRSILRKYILSRIEKRGLKNSDFLFFVSEAMRVHYERKYGFKNEKHYIMPCFNSEFDKESFYTEGKYINNTFLYAGSIDAWQCFEETLETFRKIEQYVPNAKLRIMTPNQEKARQLVNKIGIKNCFIGFAPGEQIIQEMKQAKFGFSLRDDHPVNNVSTPTKLSTYVTHGVIPICSRFICDFSKKTADNPYAVSADRDNGYSVEKIIDLCHEDIDPDIIWSKFLELYGSYYSRTYHTKHIATAINEKMQIGDVQKW